MPNAIKYNTSAESLALKKGNFWVGTGDVGKGTTESSGYYNGTTPASGGYTIYINKATGGPAIYRASNDSQLITLTNIIAGASYSTRNECLDYFMTQNDKIVTNIDYPPIVTNGLVSAFDSSYTLGYPLNGTSMYDMANGNNFSSYDFGNPSWANNISELTVCLLEGSIGTYNPTIQLGAPGITACCGAFDGYLSVVRVYTRALSAAEILTNFNAQKGYFGL